MNIIEIKIGGKLRTFRFGLGFLGEILEHLDTDIAGLGQMMEKNPFKAIPTILYFSHKSEIELTDRAVDFTMKDAYMWLEELPNGYGHPDIEKLLQKMIDSMRKYVPGLEEVYTDAEKQKQKQTDSKKK